VGLGVAVTKQPLSVKRCLPALLIVLMLFSACSSGIGNGVTSQSTRSSRSHSPNSITPSVPLQYVGAWYVHDATLTISSKGTGEERFWIGYSPSKGNMAKSVAQSIVSELLVAPASQGTSLKATIRTITYLTNGKATSNPYSSLPFKVGDSFSLRLVGPHLLELTSSPSVEFEAGYWCGPVTRGNLSTPDLSTVPRTDQQLCGL